MPEIQGWLEIELLADGGANYVLDLDGERLRFIELERPSQGRLLPPAAQHRMREWRRQRIAPQWFGLRVCDELRELAWADAVRDQLDGDPIAWIVPGQTSRRNDAIAIEDLRLLVSAWDDPSVTGIKRELEGFAALGDRGVYTFIALAPTPNGLANRLRKERPVILHLALVTQAAENGPGLWFRDETSGELCHLRAEDLLHSLTSDTRLVVFNTCYASEMALEIARVKGAMTIAWPGAISDERARAFALFFYEQMLRGTAAAAAILMFASQTVNSDSDYRDVSAARERSLLAMNPVVFVRDARDLDLQIMMPAAPVTGTTELGAGRAGGPATNHIPGYQELDASLIVRSLASIRMEACEVINPAMLINGRAPLREISISSERALPRAVIEITCDAGIGTSLVRGMIDLVIGTTPVDARRFQFPILYELIRFGIKRRPVNFRVRVLSGHTELTEETTTAWWMAQDEWIDSRETYEFLPAFIDPESQAIKDIWASVDSRIIQNYDGETASRTQASDTYVSALYQAIRALRINYIRPPPHRHGPPGARLPGQRVRSPAEVVRDRRGTCHDLALLFAACMEHIRLYPLVVLIPHHTFIGYWQSAGAHEAYWKTARPSQILNKQELLKLVLNGSIALLETTMVTSPTEVGFREACSHGSAILQGAASLESAVDIRQSRAFIDAM